VAGAGSDFRELCGADRFKELMKMTSDHAVRALNSLLPVCRTSEQGFQLAAMDVTDPELARFFAECSAQRSKFVGELEDRVRLLREEPVKTGSPVAALHRRWMELKAALADNQIHTVLAECERGEDGAVKAYVAALAEADVDDISRRLIQTQYEAVQAAHDRLRQLRDSAAYAYR
jgi:uncharacterized protein (TIGR02284 family)